MMERCRLEIAAIEKSDPRRGAPRQSVAHADHEEETIGTQQWNEAAFGRHLGSVMYHYRQQSLEVHGFASARKSTRPPSTGDFDNWRRARIWNWSAARLRKEAKTAVKRADNK
jgi:hypothetical protein